MPDLLRRELKRKHLLLDTNVLIDSVRYLDAYSTQLFSELFAAEVTPLIDQTVKLEFLRGAQDAQEYKRYSEFLGVLLGTQRMELPVTKEILELATQIARVYGLNKLKDVKLGDCIIAAQIAQYASGIGQVYLLTRNHKDFPAILFDCRWVQVVSIPGDAIRTVGIYTFRTEQFHMLQKVL